MSNAHVRYETEGPLAFLTFNRPEARNAMTWEMYQALVDACDTVEADPAVKVLILRGAGGQAFVAGTDIGQFRVFTRPEDGVEYERRLDDVIDRLECVSKPTIAQIQGAATGGGCAIAVACDLRVATPDARLGVPIARTLGNCLSAANCARFLDLIGPARLKELLFTGRLVDAAEARALGLVAQIVDAGAIDAEVRRLALAIASNAPLTIRASKEMLRRIQAHRRLESSAVHDLIVMCYTSADFKEGIEAFFAKRPPAWRGK